MKYTLYQNKQKNSAAYMKYYARPQYAGTKTTDDLAARIQRNCSMKHSDVLAVLKELQEVMIDYMQEGYVVKLDGIGNFKIGIRSLGVALPSDYKPSEHIKGVHINFQQSWTRTAGQPVVKTLSNGLSFEKAPVNKI